MTKLLPPKKIALIGDMAGFGRCSATVAIPVISALGVQACPLPTALFSSHTAYPGYYFDDYTDRMKDYADGWKRLGLHFDGIYSSFLSSTRQTDIVLDLIAWQRTLVPPGSADLPGSASADAGFSDSDAPCAALPGSASADAGSSGSDAPCAALPGSASADAGFSDSDVPYAALSGSASTNAGFSDSDAPCAALSGSASTNAGSSAPLVIVDPVMGDHGKAYATVTPALCGAMRRLVKSADIITPNLTEACLLVSSGADAAARMYGSLCASLSSCTPDGAAALLRPLADSLADLGPRRIAVTGIPLGKQLMNLICDHGSVCGLCSPLCGEARPGTGDIFASVLAACAVRGIDFTRSVQAAADFIRTCTDASHRAGMPVREGVCFEYFLKDLTAL